MGGLRIVQVIEIFRNFTGGDPDVIVFASAYWDLGRIHVHHPEVLTEDTLNATILQEYQTDLSGVLTHLEVSPLSTAMCAFGKMVWSMWPGMRDAHSASQCTSTAIGHVHMR